MARVKIVATQGNTSFLNTRTGERVWVHIDREAVFMDSAEIPENIKALAAKRKNIVIIPAPAKPNAETDALRPTTNEHQTDKERKGNRNEEVK